MPRLAALINRIYKQTGIRQQQLAMLIGTKQSMLSLYENSRRNLATAPMLKLLEIHTAIQDLPAAAMPQPSVAEAQQLAEDAAWYRFQAVVLQKKLDEVQLNYTQAMNMLAWVNEKFADKNLTAKKQRWADEQRYQMQKKLKKNGWQAQQQLSNKIALLQYHAQLLQPTNMQ